MNLRPAAAGLVLLMGFMPPLAHAQTPETPQYPLPSQDDFDPQGRNGTVLGSGARALGMGGAFLARADDATAASWNPAGLSYLRRPELSVAGAHSSFDRFDVGPRQDDRSRGASPDFASLAYPISFGSASGAVQVSFQRAVSLDFTRSIQRPGVPPTNETPVIPALDSHYRSVGGFDTLSLGTGIRVSSKVRLGFTYNRWFNHFSLETARDLTRGDALANTSVQFTKLSLKGWNVNLGAIYSPIEAVNVGAVVKTSYNASGKLFRTRLDSGFGTTGATTRQTKIRPLDEETQAADDPLAGPVQLHWPLAVGLGVSWRPYGRLTVALDFTRTYWSGSEIDNYFLLRRGGGDNNNEGNNPNDLDYGLIRDPVTGKRGLPLPYPNLDLVGTSLQQDSQQLRAGIEYVFLVGQLRLPLRAGYFRDGQNFPATVIRNDDANRSVRSFTEAPTFSGVTFGFGVVAGNTLFDVAHIYEEGRHIGNSGAVRTGSHRTLVSVIFRFGTPR